MTSVMPYYFMLFELFTIIVVAVNSFMGYFMIAAISESFKKVSQGLKKQKYLALAQILYENSILFNRPHTFKDTRYVVRAQVERIDGAKGGSAKDKEMRQWEDLANVIAANMRSSNA